MSGAIRTNASRDASNLAAGPEALFVAVDDRCLRLDPATGQTVKTYGLPPAADGKPRRWGYVAAAGKLLYGSRSPAVPNLAQQPSRYEISIDDDPSIGPQDAPIVIIEFSDFNCPYCKRWHQETFQPLMSAYQDKILFVYRDYPVTSQESFVAAQAANCAGEQGEYWAFHDALFSGPYGLGQEAYQQYAVDLGLDAAQLQECIQSGKYASEVESDARFASSLGITGTPTFFVNGIPIVGAVPLSSFKQVIDAELKK